MAASIHSAGDGPSVTGLGDQAASPLPLTELNTALDEFGLRAAQISSLKNEILAREAVVLKAILEKVTPLVPLLSRDYELYYRRELVILAREERVQLEKISFFYNEHRLILYESGQLVRRHRYGEWSESSRPAWEITEEDELTPQAAIISFGLDAIAEGLIKAFKEAPQVIILKEDLERRLTALTRILGAL